MATISISQLDTASQASVDDLYEVAVVDENSQTGYASRKLTAAQIATLIAQGIQFSGLSTEAKTIIAAINEAAQNGGSEVEPNPVGEPTDILETIGIDGTIYEVGGSEPVSKTVTGNPIHIEDAADAPIVSGTVTFEPIQDLHGYDKPWAGGAGKNKLPMTVAEIKGENTAGTWNGNTYTINDVTITILTDTDNNVTGFEVNGTASNSVQFTLYSVDSGFDATIFNGKILNGCTGGSGSTYFIRITDKVVSSAQCDNGDASISTLTNTGRVQIFINIASGVALTNVMFYPMIRNSGESATFEPYSNICPPTGLTEASVGTEGKNKLPITIESGTTNGITITVNSDGTFTANGTSNAQTILVITHDTDFDTDLIGKAVTLSGCPTGGSDSTYKLQAWYSQSSSTPGQDFGSGVQFTPLYTFSVRLVIRSGVTLSNLVFRPMIRLATETDATFEPYQSTTYTIDLDGTRYGGTVDLVSGVMSVDRAIVDLGTLTWTYDSTNRRFYNSEVLYKNADAGTILDMCCSHFESYPVNGGSAYPNVDGIIFFHISGTLIIHDYTYTDATSFTTAMDGAKLCYPLATPFTVQLTPAQIRTLEGTNNISTNMTSMSLEYITQDYQSLVKLIERSAGHHYSTQEKVVGTWIDGKPIYEKTIDVGNLPNNTTVNVAHEISDISLIVSISGFATGTTNTIPLPYSSVGGTYNINVNADTTNINIQAGYNASGYSGYVTLRYTKTTD